MRTRSKSCGRLARKHRTRRKARDWSGTCTLFVMGCLNAAPLLCNVFVFANLGFVNQSTRHRSLARGDVSQFRPVQPPIADRLFREVPVPELLRRFLGDGDGLRMRTGGFGRRWIRGRS